MRASKSRHDAAYALAALLALAATMTSCRHAADRTVGGTGPPSPLLARLWPNADGTGWTYHLVQTTWDDTLAASTVFATAAEVPPAPTLSWLATHDALVPRGPLLGADSAGYALQFSGQITTSSGVTAQNLAEAFASPQPVPSAAADPLLAALWRARPDLRARIAARLGAPPTVSSGPLGRETVSHPLFLHGYAWQRSASGIWNYGDVDTLHSWEYLSATLWTGSEFTLQLVPSLADGIYLHGRILGRTSVTTPAATFTGALRCLYLVDFGLSSVTDPYGSVIGFERTISFGTVDYVDGIGPVASTGRNLVFVGPGGRLSCGYGEDVATLTGLIVVPPLAERGMERGVSPGGVPLTPGVSFSAAPAQRPVRRWRSGPRTSSGP